MLRRVGGEFEAALLELGAQCRIGERLDGFGMEFRHDRGRVGFNAATVLREFGLAGHESKKARQLSGGMLQRVNIASALAHDPSVLLMDEPFAALDEMKREEIGEWFDRELAIRPKTVLFVTHHIDEAVMLADRLLVFSPAPGRVLEIVSVPVPRPRDSSFRQDPRFVAIAAHVRGLLMRKAVA